MTALRDALDAAYAQAMSGKGEQRHAQGLPWEDQPINRLARRHGIGFLTGQAAKKTDELAGMIERGDIAAARAEALGAMVYLAAAWSHLGDVRKVPEDRG